MYLQVLIKENTCWSWESHDRTESFLFLP
uniref:Uncharacterized protein n=1 Tax=Arundo donax TaxID=35708 RepID=A0A0A9BGE2_ARUDO